MSEMVIVTLFKDSKGEFSYWDKVVEIELNSGEVKYLHDALFSVMTAWDVSDQVYLYHQLSGLFVPPRS